MAETNEVGSREVLAGCQVSFSPIARRSNKTDEAHEVTRHALRRTVPARHPIHLLAQRTTNSEENDSMGSTEDRVDEVACSGGPGRADSNTDEACGVEENVSVLQSNFHPPQLNQSTKKRSRKGKSQGVRTLIAKARRNEGGARLVRNTTAVEQSCPNNRTCLLDAITAILPPTMNKELVCSAIASSMPAEGDTSILNISNALAAHGLLLERVSEKYIRKGGAPFHLLQEHDCRLVINIKLTNIEGRTISHFVAWDGKVIYDRPFTSMVNKTKDRTYPEISKMAFAKLYPKSEFTSWQITSVYQLVPLTVVASCDENNSHPDK